MKRRHALLLLLALWSAIFLPGLGSTELKGEEGRRILPAVTMLETGNWVVPYVGGKPFMRKPPLVNWLIAGSFRLTGVRNEWAARLPSVLSLLALGATIIAVSGGMWMETETALVAAILTLTAAAILDKGRLAEIDAIYTSLSGIATVLWLAWWTEKRSPWWLWLGPAVFLGLAALAKAPLHLLFFYAIVVAVLWRAGEWRQLLSPAHGTSLLLIGAIVAAWAVPYFRMQAFLETTAVWQRQFSGRVTGNRFDALHWALTVPKAMLDQMPWVLFAPLLWRRELPGLGERRWALFRGARLSLLVCFFALLLLPGVLPRYTLPLLPVFACLLALALAEEALPPPARALRVWWHTNTALAALLLLAAMAAPVVIAIAESRDILLIRGNTPAGFARLLLWPLLAAASTMAVCLVVLLRRTAFARPSRLAGVSGALVGCAVFLYAGAALPFILRADNVRPIAAALNETVPAGEMLYLFDPEYQPWIFYLTTPYHYVLSTEELPPGAKWVVARSEKSKRLQQAIPALHPVREFAAGRLPQLVLLQRKE